MNRYSRYTFKAKRIDNNEWIFGVPYYSEGLWWMLVDDSHSTTKTGTGSNNINIETLCQCTGLQDIDGKDIFENDIVSFMEDGDISVGITPLNIKGIIEYLEGSYVVSQENTNNKYIDLMSYTINPSFKIIGNKFDKEED